jgi:ABC-type amino acid transport system permease subunit
MESIETGLRLFVLIIVISLFFALIGFIVRKYLTGFFEGFAKKIVRIFRKTD